MDNQSINEAIEILINNFTHHPGLSQQNDSKINVFDVLQEFWQMKSSSLNMPKEDLIPKYDFLERPGTPYVCFVTLPGGACFATFQGALTKHDAKKSAALIALMNSVFNEHPLRRMNEDFIQKSIENAQRDFPNICSISLQLYKRLLDMCLHKTMLEFKQMMSVFQLLQWNGSLRAMRDRNCQLEEVIEFYKNFKIDENMRSQMSLDWINREQQQPGIILNQMNLINQELEAARLSGQELRFLKEKRDILLLASYQFDMEINSTNNI